MQCARDEQQRVNNEAGKEDAKDSSSSLSISNKEETKRKTHVLLREVVQIKRLERVHELVDQLVCARV
jgi:hypothetical protein